MEKVNNFTGYILMTLHKDEENPEVSNVIGKPRGTWETSNPMVIYNTVEELIAATPEFDKRAHTIGQVIVHLLAERVEIISYESQQEAGR